MSTESSVSSATHTQLSLSRGTGRAHAHNMTIRAAVDGGRLENICDHILSLSISLV